jgi:hypothetical protein
MVRPTHKSFELRKAISAVEVGAFPSSFVASFQLESRFLSGAESKVCIVPTRTKRELNIYERNR